MSITCVKLPLATSSVTALPPPSPGKGARFGPHQLRSFLKTTPEMSLAQTALLAGMLVRVFTPRIVARDRYSDVAVVGGVASAVDVVGVVVAIVVLLAGRGRYENVVETGIEQQSD